VFYVGLCGLLFKECFVHDCGRLASYLLGLLIFDVVLRGGCDDFDVGRGICN
jgi:hypothetical protein